MPLFYLHVCDSSGFIEDGEGQDLPDAAAARQAAVAGLRDMLAGDLRNGHLNTACFVEIENEHRQLVDTVSFAEAVRISADLPNQSSG
jgi:hypothetical protein